MPLAVSAAIIFHKGRFLAARRAPGKAAGNLWEFPGGKIEAGETAEAALVREIREELALDIVLGDKLGVFTTEIPDRIIQLHCFYAYPVTSSRCTNNQHGTESTPGHGVRKPALPNSEMPSLTLNDHSEIKWCDLSDLPQLTWAAADIPVVNWLLDSHPKSL